ncbi:MAG: dihydrofolate reductase family protein [Myxococcales bacterium]|jgi:dihydrofolate reductase
MAGAIRAYLACSLDGFIAGEGDDLSWLPQPEAGTEDPGFAAFFSQVGAVLMGRRTHDVVAGFEGPWPYDDRPLLVATRRPLSPARPTVKMVSGSIHQLVELARAAAGKRDVYIDGGVMVREALDAGRLDELTLTIVPQVLGRGVPLFAGARQRHTLELLDARPREAGMVELRYRPRRHG